jgi:hypothetical protein
MKEIDVYTRDHSEYPNICAFAQKIYREKLSLPLTNFPEVLFAIRDAGQVLGCIGLNSRVRFSLFLNDPRLVQIMRTEGPLVYGEQSILALQNCSLGLPALIATTAAYAESHGIHRIVCATIEVSNRTLHELNLETTEYGLVRLETLPEEDRPKYATWYERHKPVGCLINTTNAYLQYCTASLCTKAHTESTN